MENPLVIQPKAYPIVVHNPFSILKPVTWFSSLIRLATYPSKHNSIKWNHTANLFLDADKQWYVSESTGKGVTVQPVLRWLHSSKRRFAIVEGV